MGLVDRLAELLRRRGCLSAAEAAARLRATPSEVLSAAAALASLKAVEVSGSRLCWRDSLDTRDRREAKTLQLRDGFVALAVRCGSDELYRCARRAASLARRLAGEGGCGCRAVIPVAVRGRGARLRIVEGVAVVGEAALAVLDKLLEEALDKVRVYKVRGISR